MDRVDILTIDPRHIVLDFDRSDLEYEVCSESSFYRKVPVVLIVDNIDLFACLVYNFLYSYSIKLVLLHLILDSIVFNLNINTKFLELYTRHSFISKIPNCLHNVRGSKRASPARFGPARMWPVKTRVGPGRAGPSNRNGPIVTTRPV